MVSVANIDPQDDLTMHDDHGKQGLMDFLSGYATEVTPTQAARLENFAAILPKGTPVNVTFLPGSAFADTVATARLVKDAGYVPVPHFAARSIKNTAELSENLNRLQGEVEVSEALVIAGGLAARSIGTYLSLIGSGLNHREKVFAVVSYIPKATVQAAIGAVPLAAGVAGGEVLFRAMSA